MFDFVRKIKRGVRSLLHSEAAESIVGIFVGIAMAAVVAVGVTIPIIINVTETAGLTGITATIVGFIPVFLAIAVLMIVARVTNMT